MNFNFKKTDNFNIGIELELILVDNTSYSLKSCCAEIIQNINDEFKPFLKPEYFDSSIEITSPVFSNTHEIKTFFNKIFFELKNSAKKCNAKILAMGTHPFAKISDAKPTKDDRYQSLQQELQIILDRFLIYGMHIHIGIPDEKSAINLYNHTLRYMPVFLALSTSSPFFESVKTGLHSYRTIIFENLPRGGIPEYIPSYSQFIDACKILYEQNYIKKFNDIWWDVRIRPDLGTIELRICDSINEIERITAISSLFLAFAKEYHKRKATYISKLIIEQNKWNAIRYSLNGPFIENHKKSTIQSVALDLIQKCSLHLSNEDISSIEKIIKSKPPSEKQIKTFENTNSLLNTIKLGEI